jgi:hypothetical protein
VSHAEVGVAHCAAITTREWLAVHWSADRAPRVDYGPSLGGHALVQVLGDFRFGGCGDVLKRSLGAVVGLIWRESSG